MTDSPERSLTERLFGWARRGDGAGEGGRDAGPAVATKVLGKLLASLAHRDAPVVLDLGPVVGSNVSFLGEQLGCKLRVEDLYADVERLTREQRIETMPEFLAQRFHHEPESLDAVLCWDVLDYLDKPAAIVLGTQIVDLGEAGGRRAVLLLHGRQPDAGLHALRDCRRRTPALPDLTGRAWQARPSSRTATSSGCSSALA